MWSVSDDCRGENVLHGAQRGSVHGQRSPEGMSTLTLPDIALILYRGSVRTIDRGEHAMQRRIHDGFMQYFQRRIQASLKMIVEHYD